MAKKVAIGSGAFMLIILCVLSLFMNGKEVSRQIGPPIDAKIDTIYYSRIAFHGTDSSMAYDPILSVTGTTTDASTHTLYTGRALASNGDYYRVTADIVAWIGTNYFRATKVAAIKKSSGVASIMASNVADLYPAAQEPGTGSLACNIGVSGSSVIVQVSGAAATTVNWQANISIR